MEKNHADDLLISVVIPVKNGIDTLPSCLDGLFRQTLKDRMEVIALDSGSTDGTLELLSKYPVLVHHVPKGEFNHGETRNLGISLARGTFVVLTVQDATPASDDWIELMLTHFDNPEVAGVCGQQIVGSDPGKNPLQWFTPASEAKPMLFQFKNVNEFISLPGKKKHQYCNWDDVTAMYRKSIKEKIPFKKLMFSEDTLWANDALSLGYAIVYDYRARVYHYHHQNFKFYFKRTYIISYQNFKFYDYIRFPKNPLVSVPQILVRIARKHIPFGEKIKWFFYNINLVAASWCATLIFAVIAGTRGLKGVEASQKFFVGYPPQGQQAKSK